MIFVFVSEVDYDPDVFAENLSPVSIFSSTFHLKRLFDFSLCLCCLGIMSNISWENKHTTSDLRRHALHHETSAHKTNTWRRAGRRRWWWWWTEKGGKSLPYNIWYLKMIQSLSFKPLQFIYSPAPPCGDCKKHVQVKIKFCWNFTWTFSSQVLWDFHTNSF